MVFDSTVFLFIFLPISLLVYYLVPARFKNPVLIVCSAVFYAWGEPVHLIILAVAVVWNYVGGLLVAGRRRHRHLAARTAFAVIAADILVLVFFKYIGRVFQIAGSGLAENRFFFAPIGISFFMLQNIAYIVDVWRDEARPQRSLEQYAVFIAMFPKLIAGPFVSCEEMERQLAKRRLTWNCLSDGMLLFVRGLAKKVLLGGALATAFQSIYTMSEGGLSVLYAWIGCMLFALEIYFELGGYCDMARGLGRMFGFELPENMDYPILSMGIMDFWSRWMKTLWKWFLNYVYMPICGDDPGGRLGLPALLATWVLIGLWHGLSLSFVIWGLYFGVLLYLEGFVLGNALDRLPGAVRWIGTAVLLLAGWVFFFSPTAGRAFSYLGNMIGIGADGFIGAGGVSMLIGYVVLLIVSAVAATPVPAAFFGQLSERSGRFQTVVNCVVYAVLFLACTAGIVGGLSGEFFYFRF